MVQRVIEAVRAGGVQGARPVREGRLVEAGRVCVDRRDLVDRPVPVAPQALLALADPTEAGPPGLAAHPDHKDPQDPRDPRGLRGRPGLLVLRGGVEGGRLVFRPRIADMGRVERWVMSHPKTSAYLIVVVTLNFLLNLADVVLR